MSSISCIVVSNDEACPIKEGALFGCGIRQSGRNRKPLRPLRAFERSVEWAPAAARIREVHRGRDRPVAVYLRRLPVRMGHARCQGSLRRFT